MRNRGHRVQALRLARSFLIVTLGLVSSYMAGHYRRAGDEGRTLLQAALASAADLEVTQTELRITLAAQSSPHRTRAIAVLCEELNQTEILFPGSRLRLHYAVREAS